MTEIINSLPRGAQKELAKEFNIDKSYVSAVLNGEKKPSQTGLHIQEKAIEIAVKEIAKKMEERLKKKYLVTNNNSIKETELMVTVELKRLG